MRLLSCGAKGSSRTLLREKPPIDTAIGIFPSHSQQKGVKNTEKPFTKLTTHSMHFT